MITVAAFSQNKKKQLPCTSYADVESIPAADGCEAILCFFENGRYNQAYSVMVKYDALTCSAEKFTLLKVKVLAANGHYRDALHELAGLDPKIRQSDAAKTEEQRIKELIEKEEDQLGAQILNYKSVNTTANEMICLARGDTVQILHDTQITTALFPRKITVEGKYHFTENQSERNLTAFLGNDFFDQIGPGHAMGDSAVLVSVVRRVPFGGNSKFEIMCYDRNSDEASDFRIVLENKAAMHPTVKKDQIIFASDMDGGFGGMDLWKAKLLPNGLGYENPENLGSEINSPANEAFPFWIGDTLYYSSDRKDHGYGGFDIYRVGFAAGTPENLDAPINSAYDDFGAMGTGRLDYFVSNRSGSLGGDDIYRLKWAEKKLFFNQLVGKVDAPGIDLSGKLIELSNQEGTYVEILTLDKNGYFQVNDLKGLENYNIQVLDFQLPDESKLSLYDEAGAMIKEVNSGSDGGFKIELLTPEDYFIERMANPDESVLAVDVLGMFKDSQENAQGLKIYLEDSDGNLIGITTTDEDGRFIFESVRPDARYTIRSEVTDPNAVINILGKDGQMIQTISPENGSGAIYIRLSENDHIITLTNAAGEKIKVSEKELFNLPVLYFDLDKSTLTKDNQSSLNGLIAVMQRNPHILLDLSGHTDSRGAAPYNLELSQKRINSVIAYIETGGIERDRMTGKGYGEEQLLNHCVDDTMCTDAEHALNRRTEIRIRERNEP